MGGRAEVCSSPNFNLDTMFITLVDTMCVFFSKLLDMNRVPPNKAQRSDKSLSEEVCS